MAHLMAALHFILPNVGKPIIGVGSQVPMSSPGEDTTRNLYFALVAATANLSGAHLAFNNRIMHGLHIWKIRGNDFEAFDGPARFTLGELNGSGIELFDRVPARNNSIRSTNLDLNDAFREGVKVVHVSPGTPPKSLLHDARIQLFMRFFCSEPDRAMFATPRSMREIGPILKSSNSFTKIIFR